MGERNFNLFWIENQLYIFVASFGEYVGGVISYRWRLLIVVFCFCGILFWIFNETGEELGIV